MRRRRMRPWATTTTWDGQSTPASIYLLLDIAIQVDTDRQGRSYTDGGINGRALQHVSSGDGMTLELCASTAAAGNFKYFGMEFGTGPPLKPSYRSVTLGPY